VVGGEDMTVTDAQKVAALIQERINRVVAEVRVLERQDYLETKYRLRLLREKEELLVRLRTEEHRLQLQAIAQEAETAAERQEIRQIAASSAAPTKEKKSA
jgi:hypothetical protein